MVEYAVLGDHRTGTAVDVATREWFAARLADLGATVSMVPYSFDRYDAIATLTGDAGPVTALPLFYAGAGRVATAAPPVIEIPFAGSFPLADVDDLIGAHRDAGAVVVVTDGPGGRLVALNREPALRAGPMAVLVGARDACRSGSWRLRMRARVVAGASATVVGRLGPPGTAPAVVTTPLTGWFACAGERGTGIAIALSVAGELAAQYPVVVVGTTGHELGYLGLRRYLDATRFTPRAVLHLGAGLAAGDPGRDGRVRLGAPRLAMTTSAEHAHLLAVLERAGFTATLDPPWPGEGELWRTAGAPVLSLLGGFGRFHTPDDLPASVTSPELLADVGEAVRAAAALLVAT